GLYVVGGTATLRNSIIADNVDIQSGSPSQVPADCGKGFSVGDVLNSAGFNLIGNTSGCVFNSMTGSEVTNVPAGLGPLQDTGGMTFTRALQPGSPAIDHGNPAALGSGIDACATTDQRGLPRGGSAGLCDIGAFEVEPATATSSPPA